MIKTAAKSDCTSHAGKSRRGPRILSLCCLYPNALNPQQGIFVQRRLRHLADLAEVKVVAPFAIARWGGPKGQRIRLGTRYCARDSQDGNLSVFYPRWFYPPLSGVLIPCWLFLQLLRPMARIRKQFPFDIVDTHFGFPDGIAGALLAAAFAVPFTMTLRGNEPKHSQSWLGRFCMRWAVSRASRVFTVSERLRQFAIRLGAAPAAAKTIPNGVDAEIFRPRDRAACRRKHDLPAEARIVLSAGALVERKGHDRIVEAMRSMADEGLPTYLVIAGGPGPEGEYEGKLRALVAALKVDSAVRFVGPVPPQVLAELMSAADVLCLASTNEGWPNVVHEALACGTPVVATDVGAVPEMLAGGKYGVIVPGRDAASLKHALKDAAHKDWDRSGIAAWGQARGWRLVAEEVLTEMQTILADREERK